MWTAEMGKSSHNMYKYYFLHYSPTAGNVFHYFNKPNEVLEALINKYKRTLQEATIYAVFCFDEETQTWKGFRYEEAVNYLYEIVKNKPHDLCRKCGKIILGKKKWSREGFVCEECVKKESVSNEY